MNENKELVVIDCDLIAKLKLEGKYSEAKELLKAYYKSKKQAKNNVYNEIRRQDYLIEQFKKNNI